MSTSFDESDCPFVLLSRRELLRMLSATVLMPCSDSLFAAEAKFKRPPTIPRRTLPTRPPRLTSVDFPVHGATLRALPFSKEEQEIAQLLGNQISHAIAVVAANPGETYRPGSIAGRIQQAFMALNATTRAAATKRAQSLLSGPLADRQKLFGSFAEKGVSAHKVAQLRPEPAIQQKIRVAAEKRVQHSRGTLGKLKLNADAAQKHGMSLKAAFAEPAATYVEAWRGWKTDTKILLGTKVMLNAPEFIDFKWRTEDPKAGAAKWELVEHPYGKVLAQGSAGIGKQGVFTIDFRKYFPKTPPAPEHPRLYSVRVTPYPPPASRSRGRMVAAPLPVGPPSMAVRIAYATSDAPPQVFEFYDVYRKLGLNLLYIKMLQDQHGPGDEEFHITGFVQEAPSGTMVNLRHRSTVLDPDNRRQAPLGYVDTFHLNNPDMPDWPKVYTVVISVLEEDDGEALSKWLSTVWDIAVDYLRPIILNTVEDLVIDLASQIAGMVTKMTAQVANLIQMIAAQLAASIVSTMLSMLVAMISSAIIASMEDDFYGTEAYVLALPTNITDYVRALPGKPRADGGYVLAPQTQKFYGEVQFPATGSFDGACEIAIQWEFWQKEAL